MLKHICIAPKNSRRVQFWKKTLEQYGQELQHITYIDIIQDTYVLFVKEHYTFRLESAGEDFDTYKAIMLFGCTSSSEIQKIEQLKENFGELANFNSWSKGWKKILAKIEALSTTYTIDFINDPETIAFVFDKYKTQQFLSAKYTPCPPILGICDGYTSLLQKMIKTSKKQVFIKPCYGSSASGIMAFRYVHPEKQVLYSTIKEVNNTLYNSLKLIKYTDPKKIASIINRMTHHDLLIEEWIPKWSYNNLSIDFRVVVIKGKVACIVARGSKHMITNLHLGNQKLDVKDSGISIQIQEKIETIAVEVIAAFPKLNYAGIDILVDRRGEVYVLEVNAFGDMLLGITNEEGKTIYEQEYELLS